MDLSYTLSWMVGAASGVGLVAMLVRHRFLYPGWLFVYSLNTIVVAVLASFVPDIAGFVAAAIWAPTVLAPTMGVRYASRLVGMQRYTQARRLLQVLAALHPFDGWRDQPDLLLGLALLQRGEIDEARAVFERARSRDTWLGRIARLHLYRLDGRWLETRRWLEEHPQRAELLRDVTALSFYLRALGELEDVEALCKAYADAAKRSELSLLLPALQIFTAAFAGRPDLVEQLFAGALQHYSNELKAFWRGTSRQAAGDLEAARRELSPLAEGGSPLVTTFAARRLRSPLSMVDPASLSGASRAVIESMAREIRAGRAASALPREAPIATMTLLLINTVVFLRELPDGPTDAVNLCKLGALILEPDQSIFQGQWWRVATACVLHYGAVHLVMNLLGLAILGQKLERMVGAKRFLIVYVAAGLGSGLVFMAVAALRSAAPTILVGASGCIMGVVGALAAVLLRRWLRDRTRVSKAQLMPIAVILVAQSIFDVMTPEVAMLVHLAGAAIGFVVGGLLGEAPTRDEAGTMSAAATEMIRKRRVIRRAVIALVGAALSLGAFEAATRRASDDGACSAGESPGESP